MLLLTRTGAPCTTIQYRSRYQDLFHEMVPLLRLRFHPIFFLFSLSATTISISSGFYDGKNQPGQTKDFLNNLRYEENETFSEGLSSRFTETLKSSLEQYKQPAKEKEKKEDLKKPDKGIPFLAINKAGASIRTLTYNSTCCKG